MNIQAQIVDQFEGKAFDRPLFYSYDGGLRFQLSEDGHFLNQFLTAHKKAMEICGEVFAESEEITICVRFFGGKTLLSGLSTLRALRDAGVYPTSSKEYWSERDEELCEDEEFADSFWHYIAFKIPSEHLLNALWCALSSDFGRCLKPNPMADIYLFNLEKGVMVYPYDDRGMDLVGPNKLFLKEIYDQFGHYLLGYDREAMDMAFEVELSPCEGPKIESVFKLFKTAMKPIIEDVFGWDEAFQKDRFISNFQPEWFSWVVIAYSIVGLVCTREKSDSVHLHFLTTFSKHQRQGFGQLVVQELRRDAHSRGLPLTLSCFKNNEPALKMYQKLGFQVASEDEYFYGFISRIENT